MQDSAAKCMHIRGMPETSVPLQIGFLNLKWSLTRELKGGWRADEEADFPLGSVSFDQRRRDQCRQRCQGRQEKERDCRRVGVHRKAYSTRTGAHAGNVGMRVRSFKTGQQQNERDAGKRSKALEETRTGLPFRYHTPARSLGAQKYSIASKIPATGGTKSCKLPPGDDPDGTGPAGCTRYRDATV